MKHTSIKTRITLWYAIFILLIIGLMLFALMINQHYQSTDYYNDMLFAAMDDAVHSIYLENGEIRVESPMDSGVHVTVLDEGGNLLLGKRKFSATLKEEILRIRGNAQTGSWYLLDKPVTLEDNRTIWLRLYISASLTERTNASIFLMLLVAIPILLLVVLVGGYRMTQYAFHPLDAITQTAANISDSSDLKQRISLVGQTDEVGRLANTFDSMFARLERSLENEKHFISDASHELRTPLSLICAQSEFALMPKRTTEEKDAALRIIQECGQRTSDMLGQMLLLSRMDYQKVPLNLEKANLSDLIESIAQEMQVQADERNISISCDIAKRILFNCDEILILRMVTNLIQNAIQYGRNGGNIHIQLDRKESGIFFIVEDNGIGISEANQEKIWNRFFQVDKTKKTAGSGLGLPIIKWIVEAHGGTISISSQLGKGSRFTIHFPA